MKKQNIFIIFLIVVAYIFTGCNNKAVKNIGSDDHIKIVTSFYPIYLHVINITKGIEGIEVINMTRPQTGCLHDYQLTPNDLKTLEEADIFIINGGGMEAFMDKVISQLPALTVVNASENINLLENDDHEYNPHVWVSISGAMAQVEEITNQLANIDPSKEKSYQENGRVYIEKLDQLAKEMHAKLDPLTNKNIVTFHEAFPYFAKEFDLHIISTILKEPGTEPSAKELAQTIEMIQNFDAKGIFVEPQYSSKAADVISKSTNVKIYTLDPVVTGEATLDQEDAYIIKMKENLKTLEEALR